VDIGANLLDERFTEGIYNGKVRHEPDLDLVLKRASESGVTHIILTAGTLKESRRALDLVRELRQRNETLLFGCTIGVHPTRCAQEFVDNDLPAEKVLEELKKLAVDGHADKSVVAIGEIGLDYDRLEFCSKEIQQEYLEKQLQTFQSVAALEDLPLFLHNRNVGSDLLDVLQQDPRRKRGVVHSFDDSLELAEQFIDFGLYIGLNGCSLKTKENLEVVKALPLDRILLETDCPYCEVKPTHAGSGFIETKFEKKADKKFEMGKLVKGRNEPCQIVQVAEVIAGAKGISLKEVADACYQNSMRLYGWSSED
jgi:TatD DNase family protein